MGEIAMSEPLVSVIIPNYNYERYIGKAIESALSQTHSAVEVIVIDDGSTDGSRSVISTYGGQVQTCFQENQGLPAARNSGIQQARGEFLLFLDADDWLLPGGVADLLQGFSQFPDAGIVFGDVEMTRDDESTFAKNTFAESQVAFDFLLRENPIIVSGTLLRKTALIEAGLFNPAFRQCEDYDLWLRIALRYPIHHVGSTVARKRSHDEQLSGNIIRQLNWELRIKEALAATVRVPGVCWALGNVHHRLAYEYKISSNYRGMLFHSKMAFKKYPLRPKHWIYLGASYLFLVYTRIFHKKNSDFSEKNL